MNQRIRTLALPALVLAFVACGQEKEEAKKGHADIETLCKDGKKKEALDKALALRESNAKYKAAFDGATSSVSDKTQANVCGALVLTETGARIGS